MITHTPLISSSAACVVGSDPVVTVRREDSSDPPQLHIEVGRDRITVGRLTRHRDPVADVTRYDGAAILQGGSVAMVITVNCGASQPYLELCRKHLSGVTNFRVRVPITHEQQNHILALADPLSEAAGGI